MTTTEPAQGQLPDVPACYIHPRRETHIRCTRCDRYICPDCMREAAVGHQCVRCVKEGNKTVRQARTALGGRASGTPVVTYALIAVNVLVYLAELADPGIVDRFSGLGNGLALGGKLYVAGRQVLPGFHAVGIAHGEWYRLITSMFLHLLPTQGVFGITHILFNMWWLWALGRVVEEVMGRTRFLALYLLSGLGGSVLGYLIAPGTAAIGASGAIFGLAGAYFVISRRLRRDIAYANRLLGLYLVWLVISAAFTSWEGHLGGLLFGGALTLAYAYAPAQRRTLIQAGATAALLVLAVALVALKTSQLAGVA